MLRSAEIYDPRSGRFSATGPLTIRRHKHAAALLPNGRVLVLGGSDERDWRGRYRTASCSIRARAGSRAPGRCHRRGSSCPTPSPSLPSGAVLVAGGAQVRGTVPHTAGSSPVARLDAARYYSTATLLKDGSLLVVGGYDRVDHADRAQLPLPALNHDVHLAGAVHAHGEQLLDVGAAARAGDDRERARQVVADGGEELLQARRG